MSEENYNENGTETPVTETVVEERYGTENSNGNAPQGGKGMAVASMVLGIVAIVLSCIWYISIPCAIIGLILGIMYNKKNAKSGMATAGIVCSIIALILVVVVLLMAVAGLAFLGSSGLSNLQY